MYGFNISVLGCQMNVYDADRIRTALAAKGWEEVSEEDADVVVLVTCSIRDKAEQKAWSDIGRLASRREPPDRCRGLHGPESGYPFDETLPLGTSCMRTTQPWEAA